MHSGAGTVGWVAPEQIRRQAALVGPATDLYALGCVMYRVLSGKEIFEGNAQDVLRAHKRTPVPMPHLPDDVPIDAGKFILRLLEKKPWQRYEFAADARRAWALIKPVGASTLEEVVQSSPSSRAAPAAYARSLAPGILSACGAPMLVARHEAAARALGNRRGRGGGDAPRQQLAMLIGEAGVGKSRLAEWLAGVTGMAPCSRCAPATATLHTPLDGIAAAINAHAFGLEGADRAAVEQAFITRWEVGKDDDEALTWVAATAGGFARHPGVLARPGPSGKRWVWTAPSFVSSSSGVCSSSCRATARCCSGWTICTTPRPTRSRRSRACAGTPADLPLLLVATARSETLATDLDAALRMEAMRAEWNGKVLELKPLATDDTEALLRTALPLDDGAVRRAVEQSRGNPLFALQLLYAWAGGGYFSLESGKYRVPEQALAGRAITTAELWDERVRAIPTELRLSAYAAAALGDDIRGDVLKTLCASLGMDPRDALVALTRAQILLAAGNDQFRWPHALLQEHLLDRLQERNDAPAIYRLAASTLAHPAVGSRRM